MYLTFQLARRILDEEAAYAAALVAALPPTLIAAWSVNGRLHYALIPVLGVLFLLLTVDLMIIGRWRGSTPCQVARFAPSRRTSMRTVTGVPTCIEVTQTGADGADNWSIDEFNAYGPAAGRPG